jgi:hypothetical protein
MVFDEVMATAAEVAELRTRKSDPAVSSLESELHAAVARGGGGRVERRGAGGESIERRDVELAGRLLGLPSATADTTTTPFIADAARQILEAERREATDRLRATGRDYRE